MTIPARRIAFLAPCLVAMVLAFPLSARAEKPDAASQTTFDRLVQAIQTKDRAKFIDSATDDMKKAFTPELMEKINHDLAPHLEKGFDATYLAELHQKGYTVKLWKVTFKDGSDDMVLRIAMKGDQVAGFFRE